MKLGRVSCINVIITVNLIFICLCIYVRMFRNTRTIRWKSQERVELEMDWLNRGKVNQDSWELVELVRDYYISPRSEDDYNFNTELINYNKRQIHPEVLAPIIKKIAHGSFIECGAFDEEYLSNTLWLEKKFDWTGLLVVEANPKLDDKLRTKQRKAWQTYTCLSKYTYPERLSGQGHPTEKTATQKNQSDAEARSKTSIQCIPLYTFFLALNKYKWDFFSLNTGGTELEILKTIPFDIVLIKIIMIKSELIPGGPIKLDDFMTRKDYKFYIDIHGDRLYIHQSVWDTLVGVGVH